MDDQFEIDKLSKESQAIGRLFLARFPDLRSSCSTESIAGVPGRHLLIRIHSPGGADRDVTIWMNNGDEPSLAFGAGGWHTHTDHLREVGPGLYQDESLLDLLAAILGDEFVVYEELGAGTDSFCSCLDLRAPNALEEELTNPHCSDRIRIKTFSGRGDREVGLADLDG